MDIEPVILSNHKIQSCVEKKVAFIFVVARDLI